MEDDTDRMPELSETEALVQLICDRIDAVVLSDTDFFADSGQIRSATAASGLQPTFFSTLRLPSPWSRLPSHGVSQLPIEQR